MFAGRVERDSGERGERIVLSTIHQAKGLEWDSVFVIHLADMAFPNRRAMSEVGGLEEERRLFYVAVTRARRRLFLTYPITMGTDTLMLNQPSLFLEEIPPYLMERLELREARMTQQTHRLSSGPSASRDDWSWEGGGYEEPTIRVDEPLSAKPATKTVWKSSSKPSDAKPRTSFLRDVSEL